MSCGTFWARTVQAEGKADAKTQRHARERTQKAEMRQEGSVMGGGTGVLL